jgi:CTP:molybdopterin cytidylyltransferase MocA
VGRKRAIRDHFSGRFAPAALGPRFRHGAIIVLMSAPIARRRPEPDEPSDAGGVVGLLLAAGAGRRAGGPKALRTDPDGTSWLLRSIAVLRDGGCDAVAVVLGCSADSVRELLTRSDLGGDRLITVVAADWQQGMGVSLRTGLLAVQPGSWRAVLIHLVDLPDVTAAVVSRVLQRAPLGTAGLVRAVYRGRPGHPVLLGRDHLESVLDELAGDRGAQDYLARHGVDGVECGDLATGRDRDR